MDALEAKIDSILVDDDLSALDEDGEGVLVPTVAILSALFDHCNAPSPHVEKVLKWKQKYLAVFDDQIDGLEPASGYAEERRRVIEETFAKLERQAAEFYKDDEAIEARIIG